MRAIAATVALVAVEIPAVAAASRRSPRRSRRSRRRTRADRGAGPRRSWRAWPVRPVGAIAPEVATVGAAIRDCPSGCRGGRCQVSRRSRRRSRRSDLMSRVSPRTSPERSGATACAARDRSKHQRKVSARHAECHQCVAKHCEILQRSVGARPHPRAVRGGRRRSGTGVKASPMRWAH